MNRIFNPVLIKKDFKLNAVAFFFSVFFYIVMIPYQVLREVDQAVQRMSEGLSFYNYGLSADYLYSMAIPLSVMIALALALSIAKEKQDRTLEDLARMPFSRLEIFMSKTIVSIVVIVIPIFASLGLLALLSMTRPEFSIFINLSDYLNQAIIVVLTGLYVYFFYVLVGMFFGSWVGTLLCGGVFSVFPVGLTTLILMNLNIPYRGEEDIVDFMLHISPGALIASRNGVLLVSNPITLIVLMIIFAVAGYIMFTTYKMEKNSEFLTYKWTEPVFKAGFFICCVLTGRIIINGMLNIETIDFIGSIIGMILGGVIGYFVPKAVIDKNRVA